MNKAYLGVLLFLSGFSYSQNKVENGTYLSTIQGQNIKLKLDDNKYEMVVFYGDYEVKNDTLHLNNNHSQENNFSVAFSSEANPALGKVKVKLTGESIYYYSVFFGTQSGTAEPSFKAVRELVGDDTYDKTESFFEVNRSDYFYLVKEDYNGESTLEKYALPRSSNEIQIQYNPNYLGDVKLQGYLNEKGELVISEKSKKNPMIFVEENKKPKVLESQIKPVETTKKQNWTYAGKEEAFDYFGGADSASTPATSYKLIIQDNLQKALEATKKSPSKLLVVSYDPDNKDSKDDFNAFVKNQEYSIGAAASYEEDPKRDFDRYNYYNATAKDKSWATKNKISDNPSTIVLDTDGTILSQTKGNISSNQYLFDVYSNSVQEGLKQVKSLKEFEKAFNEKAKDVVILKKMVELSDYANGWSVYAPPPVVEVSAVPNYPASNDDDVKDEIVEEIKTVPDSDYYTQNEPVYTRVNIDKKKLLSTWDKIVNSHAKDVKPNMDFVTVALAEIQNMGFYKKIYYEDRLYDETNFKAIDYLVKHYDAILGEQSKKLTDSAIMTYDSNYELTIETILPNAIMSNANYADGEVSAEYHQRILGIYKKLIEKQSGNSYLNSSYFDTLEKFASKGNGEKEYVSEYDSFFNKLFANGNEIEVLNDLFSERIKSSEYSNNDWTLFKGTYAQMSNQAGWFVVEKSSNPESIKKAIKWSESSLRIEKNSPYYLDTLAQLYYKNGEKQKAISTQEKAVKYADGIDETTKNEMQTVLEKMKNGTY